MRVLIDTHAFVWAIQDPERLTPRVKEILSDGAVELIVSSILPWEISTKVSRGKWPEAEPIMIGFSQVLRRLGAVELPLSTEHALVAGHLTWDHRDPFDRALAAQSILEQAPLVTADPQFSRLPGMRVLW